MNLYDNTVTIDSPRLTKDGYLTAEARVARTGVQLYRADEIGLDGDPNRIVRVYRPPDEVFSVDAMKSYAYRPVTVNHPDQMVDAENWKEHSRGQTGGEVLRDKEFVRVPMLLMDASAIREWKEGKRELSMGYTMDLDTTAGTTPEGEQYDAVQRNLRMNHLALVTRARGGSQLKLGDETTTKEGNEMPDVKLTTVTVDGFSVETTDAGAQAIAKLSKDLADERAAKVTAETSHAEALKAKDKELATKDAKIDELGKKVMSDDAMDKAVKDRADLITTAKGIADVDYSGKTADDIRKMAVVAKLGADSVKDKSADYITARFDILAEDANADPVRQALRAAPGKKQTGDAYDEYVERISNAWKPQKEAH
jgi:hypothetical protein